MTTGELQRHFFQMRTSPGESGRVAFADGADDEVTEDGGSAGEDPIVEPLWALDSDTRARVEAHPMYAHIVRVYFEVVKAGLSRDHAAEVDALQAERLAVVQSKQRSMVGVSPRLDDFLTQYLANLLVMKEETESAYRENALLFSRIDQDALTVPEARNVLRTIAIQPGDVDSAAMKAAAPPGQPRSDGGGQLPLQRQHQQPPERGHAGRLDAGKEAVMDDGSASAASDGSDDSVSAELAAEYSRVVGNLRRKYADSGNALESDFGGKRKKNQLSEKSTALLRAWWDAHPRWPYPDDGQKDELMRATGLSVTQVNNWFINQRKRHWTPLQKQDSNGGSPKVPRRV